MSCCTRNQSNEQPSGLSIACSELICKVIKSNHDKVHGTVILLFGLVKFKIMMNARCFRTMEFLSG